MNGFLDQWRVHLTLLTHLLFIQKHETHDDDVDVPPDCPIFEETGDLVDTQTGVVYITAAIRKMIILCKFIYPSSAYS